MRFSHMIAEIKSHADYGCYDVAIAKICLLLKAMRNKSDRKLGRLTNSSVRKPRRRKVKR